MVNLASKMNFLGHVYYVKWFPTKKLNTRRDLEHELAANCAEPVNQAELEPAPGHDQKNKLL